MTDELEAGLKRRDVGFLLRVALRLAVLALVVLWAVQVLGDYQVGGCVADGFRAVTGEPAPATESPATESPAPASETPTPGAPR